MEPLRTALTGGIACDVCGRLPHPRRFRLTHELADLDANILGLHVHPLDTGVRDELVVSTPDGIDAESLLAAIEASPSPPPNQPGPTASPNSPNCRSNAVFQSIDLNFRLL